MLSAPELGYGLQILEFQLKSEIQAQSWEGLELLGSNLKGLLTLDFNSRKPYKAGKIHSKRTIESP